MDSKRYNNIKLVLGIAKAVISFILIFLFIYTGLSSQVVNYLSNYSENNYAILLLFAGVTGIAGGILFFPMNFYSGYTLEHKYNLSNQTLLKYFLENLKGNAVALVIGLPILLLFYFMMNSFGSLWWLPFAVMIFLISVILARILPVFILPLFYKQTPIDNEELKERISKLGKAAGLKVEAVFRFDMSKNTRKANAAFTGIGKSKRILLGDTLLDNFSNDEVETVIAHEMGHYKKKHIIKNIIIGTASSFLTLFLISVLYENSLGWFGFNKITDIDALPLLSLWGMLIGLLQSPLSNILSRKYEFEADEYAVLATGKASSFISSLNKLTEQNLGDRDPHPFIEWFFYSHPSVKNRIKALEQISMGDILSDNRNKLNLQEN